MTKTYDAHCHWMPPAVAEQTSFFKRGWSDIGLLLDTLDQSGVEKGVLLYPTSDAHLKMGGWGKLSSAYNQAIAEEVKQYPDRLIGCGILPVDQPEDMPKEIGRIQDLGLSGLCLASSYQGRYLDHPGFLPIFEQAEQRNMPIFVHSQIINPIGFDRVKDPLLMPVVEYVFDITICAGQLMMSGVFNRFSKLKFIFAHFAGVLPFLSDRFDTTYAMLRSRELVKDLRQLPSQILGNIFVDTSGVKSASMLKMALDFFGPKRIVWGSDFPAKKNLSESIAVFDELDIKPQEKGSILFGNLEEILQKGE